MSIIKNFQKMLSPGSTYKMSDMRHYIVGNYRYWFYYGGKLSKKFAFVAWLRKKFIRTHIKEQITWRIKHMDRECYNEGSCKLCGCETTALQMCNKSCEKPCYPPMLNKEQWKDFYDRFVPLKSPNGDTWILLAMYEKQPLLLNDSKKPKHDISNKTY